MNKLFKRFTVGALVLALSMSLALIPDPAGATGPSYRAGGSSSYRMAREEPSGQFMFVDLFFLRPIGFAATVIGAGTFLVSLPFSAAGGNIEQARQALVDEPANYTFRRPLGESY